MAKKAKHLKKATHPLNVLVDKALYEKANKVRVQTWVEVVELALRAVITAAGGKKKKAA